MSHELDFTRGQAAIAFRGETPWHGLGFQILPEDSVDDIRIKAGLDYDVVKTPVQYGYEKLGPDMLREIRTRTSKDRYVLHRSDTGDDLSVVSSKYQVVQPRQIVEFYRDLVEQYGFELEVVGALAGGRKVWALANTKSAFQLRDKDEVRGYLLLATSYDGTMATQARFTSVRVVCNNTLSLASAAGRADVTVPHNTTFDADKVKLDLQVGKPWEEFQQQAQAMQNRLVSRDETVKLFLQAYYGLGTTEEIKAFQADETKAKAGEKLMGRLTTALFESPGAQLASARGTLWGALNAVTHDVDFSLPSRSSDTRLSKAWFGAGESIKQRAFDAALKLVA